MRGLSRVYVPDDEYCWVRASVIEQIDENRVLVRIKKESNELNEEEENRLYKYRENENKIISDDVINTPELTPDEFDDYEYGEEREVVLNDERLDGNVLPLQNPWGGMKGIEDMCWLNYLHEPAILYNLKQRFFMELPYTYVDNIVIALNPFQWLPIYDEEIREKYIYHKKEQLMPHIYSTSSSAFKGLRDNYTNQSILVSGESGAGKTETVKLLMEHLASISTPPLEEARADSVVKKVLESNPLLECFGNAKTKRNDNSSRFGKFTQMQFTFERNDNNSNKELKNITIRKKKKNQNKRFDFRGTVVLVGSVCQTYLLEKSRVTQLSDNERTYHIFYTLLRGMNNELKSSLYLDDKTIIDFNYLKNGDIDIDEIDGMSDEDRFNTTDNALSLIGIDSDSKLNIYRCISLILYLGELRFEDENDAIERESLYNSNNNNKPKKRSSITLNETKVGNEGSVLIEDDSLDIVQKLIGCNINELNNAICNREMITKEETFLVPLTKEKSEDARDALSKQIYSYLFDWLVSMINDSTYEHSLVDETYLIGLLDIFGFEVFQENLFEQFCINYANEKLQQKFTQDIFKTVQKEYIEEDIDWNHIEFIDNVEILKLIEGRMGIISVLNEECYRPGGEDESLGSKLSIVHKDNKFFIKDRFSVLKWSIKHYAGPVQYTTIGFLEKNRDALQNNLITLMKSSSNSLLSMIFASPQHSSVPISRQRARSRAGSRARVTSKQAKRRGSLIAETISTKFKNQLSNLMMAINETDTHYIRCIKTNEFKSPEFFNHKMIISQLRCAGVIEAIRISRSAYPNRMEHEEFIKHFQIIVPNNILNNNEEGSKKRTHKQLCQVVASYLIDDIIEDNDEKKNEEENENKNDKEEKSTAKSYQVGKTRIYFQSFILEILEKRRQDELEKYLIIIQKYARRMIYNYQFTKMKKCALIISKYVRMYMNRKHYLHIKKYTIKIQSILRMIRARRLRKYLRLQYNSTLIQSNWRCYYHHKIYKRRKNGCINIQSYWRMIVAKRNFIILLEEAKEQAKLENQLKKLKEKFEEEKRARLQAEKEQDELRKQLINQRKRRSIEVIRNRTNSNSTDRGPPNLLLLNNENKNDDDENNDILGLFDENKEDLEIEEKLAQMRIDRRDKEISLMNEQENMLSKLESEVHRLRIENSELKNERDILKTDYQKVIDLNETGGDIVTALQTECRNLKKEKEKILNDLTRQKHQVDHFFHKIDELSQEKEQWRMSSIRREQARIDQHVYVRAIIKYITKQGVGTEIVETVNELWENATQAISQGLESEEWVSRNVAQDDLVHRESITLTSFKNKQRK